MFLYSIFVWFATFLLIDKMWFSLKQHVTKVYCLWKLRPKTQVLYLTNHETMQRSVHPTLPGYFNLDT